MQKIICELKPFELKVRDASKTEFRDLWKNAEKCLADLLMRCFSGNKRYHKLICKSLSLKAVHVYSCVQAQCRFRQVHRKLESRIVPALSSKIKVREKEFVEIDGKGKIDPRSLGVWENPFFPTCEKECDDSWMKSGKVMPYTCVEMSCPTCQGKGTVTKPKIVKKDKECPNCFGSGLEATGLRCRRCGGSGHFGQDIQMGFDECTCFDCEGQKRVRKYMVGQQKVEMFNPFEMFTMEPVSKLARMSIDDWSCIGNVKFRDGNDDVAFAKTGNKDLDAWLEKTWNKFKERCRDIPDEFKGWKNREIMDSLDVYAREDCVIKFDVSLLGETANFTIYRYDPKNWIWVWPKEQIRKYLSGKEARKNRKSAWFWSSLAVLFSVIAGTVVAVHRGWVQNPMLNNYVSLIIEYALVAQRWIMQKMPSVYNFWNWPAVLSLFVLAVGSPLLNDIWGLLALPGVIAAGILAIALPFMDGISWYLAIGVDCAAFVACSLATFTLKDCKVSGILYFLNRVAVICAMAYVVIHFFF